MAFADPDVMRDLAQNFSIDDAAAQSMRDPAEAFHRQAEEFRDAFKDRNFGIDPKQLDQMKQQMQEFNKEFNADGFKFDPKQMDEFKQQMDELKRQLEEMQSSGSHHMV